MANKEAQQGDLLIQQVLVLCESVALPGLRQCKFSAPSVRVFAGARGGFLDLRVVLIGQSKGNVFLSLSFTHSSIPPSNSHSFSRSRLLTVLFTLLTRNP